MNNLRSSSPYVEGRLDQFLLVEEDRTVPGQPELIIHAWMGEMSPTFWVLVISLKLQHLPHFSGVLAPDLGEIGMLKATDLVYFLPTCGPCWAQQVSRTFAVGWCQLLLWHLVFLP